MPYRIVPPLTARKPLLLIAGCGGTGNWVAEGIARWLPADWRLVLVDPDVVEEHNLRRQGFLKKEVGSYKAEVLARRLADGTGRAVGFAVVPIRTVVQQDHELRLVVGCVDNAAARREVHEGLPLGAWWLDAGNGRNSGQVLLGNVRDARSLEGGFAPTGTCDRVPLPTLQMPELLVPSQEELEPLPPDCAEAVRDERQSPVVNQAVAGLALNMVWRFLRGELDWMAAYLDLDMGTLRHVPCEPATVARLCGVKTRTLLARGVR